MGIPTLIKTLTASDSASLAFVDGAASVVLDGTYDEYMFVFTDINAATDTANLTFQCSIDSGSNYNVAMTTTRFRAYLAEDNSSNDFSYSTGGDQAQGTAYQRLIYYMGNGSDESGAGTLNLFSPSNTTYVKHFYSTTVENQSGGNSVNAYTAGYFNTTSAIDAISFKMSSGNFDGVIQMYGIA